MRTETVRAANEYLAELLGENRSTVIGLLVTWDLFVHEIEAGYSLSIYDYDNDVESRILLEKTIRALPAEAGQEILDQVEKSDEMFYRLTRPVTRRLGNMNEIERKWLSRIPVDLSEDMKADLDNIVSVDDGVEK